MGDGHGKLGSDVAYRRSRRRWLPGALLLLGQLCAACTEKPLTDEELDLALRNARVGVATACLKAQAQDAAEVTVKITMDVDPRGEPRYVKAQSDALSSKSTDCMQEALMRLRFRTGGTAGPRARTMIVNLKDDLPPSLTW